MPELGDELRKLALVQAACQRAQEPASDDDTIRASEVGSIPDQTTPAPLIEGYEITRELHRGGQGVVFQAIQKSTKRKVAIKVLLEGPYASKSAKKRFEREIELVAQLQHANIIAVFHSGHTKDGHAFCVMDYVRGLTLDTYVRSKELTLEEVLRLLAIICNAVNYAHQKGVIHRDLKPSNILVDMEGSPKVLDFGLAKQLLSAERTLVSVTGQVVGTLPYMSPEQARGHPDEIDIRTDVYALGVIIYEVLTGQYPYPVLGRMADVLRHIAETPPTPPSRSWKKESGVTKRTSKRLRTGECPIDDEVQTIVMRSLAKERERRYQSAGELARDIGHYLNNEPIEAKRDSAFYVIRKQMRRYRAQVAASVAFVGLLLVGLIVATWLYHRAESERVRADAARTDAERKLVIARNGADLLLFGICDELPKVAGTGELQKDLLEKALEYNEKLAAERPDDIGQQRRIWLNFHRLGYAYLRLGEIDRAAAAFEQFHRMVAAVVSADPTVVGYQDELSLSYERLGEVAWRRGDFTSAADYYQKKLAIAEQLASAYPKNLRFQESMSTSYLVMGDIAQRRGDLSSAADFFERRLAISKQLADIEPANLRYQDQIGVGYARLGDLARRRGRHAEAIDHFKKKLAIDKRLADAEPDNPRYQDNLSVNYERLGHLSYLSENLPAATEYFEQMLSIVERLASRDPNDIRYQENLAISYLRLGELALKRGIEATGLFHKALAFYERLAANEPENFRYQDNVSVCHVRLGELARQREDFLTATRNFENALNLSEKLAAAEPHNPRFQAKLTTIYSLLAALALDQDDAERAKFYLTKQIAVARKRAIQPDASAEALNAYARLLLTCKPTDLRDPAAALSAAKHAAGITESSSSEVLDTLALAYFQTGDAPRAIEVLKEAIRLLKPGNAARREEMEAALARFRQAISDSDKIAGPLRVPNSSSSTSSIVE